MKSTDESMTRLIDACHAGAKICYGNGIKCKEMGGMEDCYHSCINCSEACEKVIAEYKADSENLNNAIDLCAHICGECSKECAKHDYNHCRECSEVCLKCAEICSEILGKENSLAGTNHSLPDSTS
jgi:hypothetical protein